MSDLEGVMLSDYLLEQCISRGGIADVYRARQVEGTRDSVGAYEVVVKVFRPTYAQRDTFREYFITEADKIGKFDHPNILPYLEYGEGEGLLYLVTPYVPTGTLEDLLKRVGGRFSAMQALPILQQLCSALQYAHDHGVIHGNMKPTNVFVTADGRMLLSDFGITRGYDDRQQSLTRVGWGSAEYAAPEQSLGIVKRASDVYALGVLLFRLLTGSPPFTGQTPVEVLLKHVRQQPPSARSLVPHISDAVDGVIRMALQKRAENRFASASEFSDALLAAVTVAPVASPVARLVVPTAPPALTDQVSFTNDPLTPPPPSALDPQTPVPPFVTFNISPALGIRPETTHTIDDITQMRKKHFLQEDSEDSSMLFWSADPAEWSPLAQNVAGDKTSSVPLTASEYLELKERQSSEPTATTKLPDAHTGAEPGAAEEAEDKLVIEELEELAPPPAKPEKEQARKTPGWLNRWLPIIVVILLVLGLLGALLSAFFFPTSKPGTNIAPAPLAICVDVGASRNNLASYNPLLRA
jgi:serine/threonine protein kinase